MGIEHEIIRLGLHLIMRVCVCVCVCVSIVNLKVMIS
jgi:hypothetical protein